MTEQSPPTPDPILTTLQDREAALLTELAAANQAVAVVNGRIDEVRDMIGKMTDGRRRPRKKAAEVNVTLAAAPTGTHATAAAAEPTCELRTEEERTSEALAL